MTPEEEVRKTFNEIYAGVEYPKISVNNVMHFCNIYGEVQKKEMREKIQGEIDRLRGLVNKDTQVDLAIRVYLDALEKFLNGVREE